MKKIILNFLLIFMSMCITIFGLLFFSFWLKSEITILSFFIGFIGYYLGVKPTVEYWLERLKESHGFED
jgi:hypothetical protein